MSDTPHQMTHARSRPSSTRLTMKANSIPAH